MDRRTDDPLEFAGWFDLSADGTGATGLTVTVDVYNPAGTKVVTDGAATEIGGGLYAYTHTMSPASAGKWLAVFKTAAATVSKKHSPSELFVARGGVENLDAAVSTRSTLTAAQAADGVWDEALAGHAAAGSAGKALSDAGSATDPLTNAVPGAYAAGSAGAALGRIGTGQVTAVVPVSSNGDATVIRGDTYDSDESRQLVWIDTSAAWPTLTGCAVILTVRKDGAQVLSIACTIDVATGASKQVSVELTSAQTTAFALGYHAYDIEATTAAPASHKITLVRGSWLVIEDQTHA